jgi:prolyl-tRNA synthetase
LLYSKLFIPTQKDVVSDIESISTKLMLKSGMIRQIASGIYEFLPLGVRVLRKIINLIRYEMDSIGGQEIILPLIIPKHLFMETNRWNNYGKELFKLKDRKNAEFCLVPTAEEMVIDLIRNKYISYKQLPIMFYQFGLKYRDELRPRFGLLRSREFLMKDAYSFHENDSDLNKYYKIIVDSYTKLCTEFKLKFKIVKASSGKIGGTFSNEFIAISNTGEEEIVWCDCGYSVTIDMVECLTIKEHNEELLKIEKVLIVDSNNNTINAVAAFCNVPIKKIIKAIIYLVDNNPIIVLVRGDHEVNEVKLQKVLQTNNMLRANTQTIKNLDLAVGFVGPIGVNNIKIIADLSVIEIKNAISGANQYNYYIKNLNYMRGDYNIDIIADIRKFTYQDVCPKCQQAKLHIAKGIEIGHTFKLGTYYSKIMNGTYINHNGQNNLFYMGCYGIGITRIMMAVIEQYHDKDGIIWPNSIAPFKVIIIPIDYNNNDDINKATEYIYKQLISERLDVLIDDRITISTISKIKDADLLGVPYRIIINEKHMSQQLVELRLRRNNRNNIHMVHINKIAYKILTSLKYK